MSWLSLVIWLPILGGLTVLLIGEEHASRARWVSLLIALLAFIVSLPLYFQFDPSFEGMQFVERYIWSEKLGTSYYLGADGFSVPLVILNTFITILAILSGWESIKDRPAQYFAAFLILEGFMNGIFVALDGIMFYIFFEAMLIPMFLIIGVWGGPGRIYAAMKFFVYTFLGSMFLLFALIYLYIQTGKVGDLSFSILDFQNLSILPTAQGWLFFALLIGFAIKVPMWPVHTWLPLAHVEAPTGGSVVLAALMLKVGGYGFVRFILPIAPYGASTYALFAVIISLIAVVYIALVAIVQADMKKMIAYSSVTHMGFVTLGFMLPFGIAQTTGSYDAAQIALQGGMMQMISHGFVSAAMFLCIGVLYDRVHSREIADYGGVVHRMPYFAMFFVLFAMANLALPGTSGFVGEFWVVLASFHYTIWVAIFAASALILSAAYNLWLTKRVIYGEVIHKHVDELKDINGREWIILGSLAILVIGMGFWPEPIAKIMHTSIDILLDQISVGVEEAMKAEQYLAR